MSENDSQDFISDVDTGAVTLATNDDVSDVEKDKPEPEELDVEILYFLATTS